MKLHEEFREYSEMWENLNSGTQVLTEATEGDTIQNSLQALVDDINSEVKPTHSEINKVIISKKTANTVIVLTTLGDEAAIKDKGEALKKDIVAKIFDNKDFASIGITFTAGTTMPLRLSYTISDIAKFSAFYNGSSDTSSENTSAAGTALSVDKVKGIELLETEADKKGITAIVDKINSTALKSTISGLTLSKGEDFLAFTVTVPSTTEEKAIASLVDVVPKWFTAIGWKYSASEPDKTTKDNVVEIKFKPLYKKFF
jgi:hypothetical protein